METVSDIDRLRGDSAIAVALAAWAERVSRRTTHWHRKEMVKPWGTWRNINSAVNTASTTVSPKRRPLTRWHWITCGVVSERNSSSSSVGSRPVVGRATDVSWPRGHLPKRGAVPTHRTSFPHSRHCSEPLPLHPMNSTAYVNSSRIGSPPSVIGTGRSPAWRCVLVSMPSVA